VTDIFSRWRSGLPMWVAFVRIEPSADRHTRSKQSEQRCQVRQESVSQYRYDDVEPLDADVPGQA